MEMTIEERARKYATKLVGGEYEGGFKGEVWLDLYHKYIEIATEQHKIDIEKVRRFLEREYAYNGSLAVIDDLLIEDLCKALEE